jgi:hypothetical protein
MKKPGDPVCLGVPTDTISVVELYEAVLTENLMKTVDLVAGDAKVGPAEPDLHRVL